VTNSDALVMIEAALVILRAYWVTVIFWIATSSATLAALVALAPSNSDSLLMIEELENIFIIRLFSETCWS
jgi:hypothetical protein